MEDFEKIKNDPTFFILYKSLNANKKKMETSHYFRNEIFINQIKKTHLDKTDESEYLREKINIILEEDDEKETFNNYLKPYKSLRYLKTIFSLKIF